MHAAGVQDEGMKINQIAGLLGKNPLKAASTVAAGRRFIAQGIEPPPLDQPTSASPPEAGTAGTAGTAPRRRPS